MKSIQAVSGSTDRGAQSLFTSALGQAGLWVFVSSWRMAGCWRTSRFAPRAMIAREMPENAQCVADFHDGCTSRAILSSQMDAEGPVGWRNWRAAEKGSPPLHTAEFPLFSDSWLVGHAESGLGPYAFLNTIRGDQAPDRFPAAVLRAAWHLSPDDAIPPASEWTTDVQFYHAGDFADELTALLSLCLGMRAQAGGQTRLFGSYVTDPLGRPTAYAVKNVSPLPEPRQRGHSILPHTGGQRSLADICRLSPFPRYPGLAADGASALVQSARLYQEAIWIAEQRPEWSWILLVSAIERAAGRWHKVTVDPLEWLCELKPRLRTVFSEAARLDLLGVAAEELKDYIGAKKRLVSFVLEFLPRDPPPARPPDPFQVPWTRAFLETALERIYKWRSKYLHLGVPFPAPMCEAPYRERGWDSPAEKPIGLGMQVPGGTWLAKDTPLMLHVFEYVTRSALLEWWKWMTPGTKDLNAATTAELASTVGIDPEAAERIVAYRELNGSFRLRADLRSVPEVERNLAELICAKTTLLRGWPKAHE